MCLPLCKCVCVCMHELEQITCMEKDIYYGLTVAQFLGIWIEGKRRGRKSSWTPPVTTGTCRERAVHHHHQPYTSDTLFLSLAVIIICILLKLKYNGASNLRKLQYFLFFIFWVWQVRYYHRLAASCSSKGNEKKIWWRILNWIE